ncbi:biotin carboxylase N-terminal domain-containing protein [Nonomuraea sp. NPDC059023]|uniref:ATP-binding protein n=1 Tax=unclassified Nonomuraea TaxID=2593643 RepID=UPI0036BC0275
MTVITRLLVANRGEIARRVFRTCRELGIETVAVFSDADADAPHVAEADHAVRLSGVTPSATYLDISRIIEAARMSGADAIHPGYGFLSENAAFAQAVLDAGLTWVGPSPGSIAAMGSKVEAKRLMTEAGVPVLPSLPLTAPTPPGTPEEQTTETTTPNATPLGPPVGHTVDTTEATPGPTDGPTNTDTAKADRAAPDNGALGADMRTDVHVGVADAVTAATAEGLGANAATLRPGGHGVEGAAPGAGGVGSEAGMGAGGVGVEGVGGVAYPLLVKASAGGGGRGMRVVRSAGELEREVASARREAEAAFGDGTVFVEPLLEGARHIEVQILADTHGTVWALGERECSVQRRHQKVLEECPSPAISGEMRDRLQRAAVSAARAIGYTGAGTVEFLVKDDTVAFLEMNTRLQVEHPVTELVYGVDLVRLQLEVAEGAALPEAPPEPAGHAIEVRLYAEDAHYVPQSGTLHRFEIDGPVRVDSGVESGSVVSTHYDAMLAKVIAHGATRNVAIRKLTGALKQAKLHGLTTNRDLLLNILKNPDYVAGATHTGFLDQHDLTATPEPTELEALAAALALAAANRAGAKVLATLPAGWRNVRSQEERARFAEIEVVYRPLPEGVTVVAATPYRVVLERDGIRHAHDVARYDDAVYVGSARLTPLPRLPEPVEHVAPGSLLAPMPGSVLRVEVEPGDRVTKGQVVLVLEAMKMEHQIAAPADGVVAGLRVEKGQQVEAGSVLAIIQEGDE